MSNKIKYLERVRRFKFTHTFGNVLSKKEYLYLLKLRIKANSFLIKI